MPKTSPPRGDDFGRADEHGHVAVVPAGVGYPGFLGAEVLLQALVTLKIIIFLNFKLCEIQLA